MTVQEAFRNQDTLCTFKGVGYNSLALQDVNRKLAIRMLKG